MSGEAYFEVSRNKTKPFVVNSNDVRTCVLGTKFNVRARPSEEKVVTTLLKGSVKVQLPGQSEEEGILLKPGQMLSVDNPYDATHAYRSQPSGRCIAMD